MIALLMAGHLLVGQGSLILALEPDNLRRILGLARPEPESGSGLVIGGVIPLPSADSSLNCLMAGPQVDQRGVRLPLLTLRLQSFPMSAMAQVALAICVRS